MLSGCLEHGLRCAEEPNCFGRDLVRLIFKSDATFYPCDLLKVFQYQRRNLVQSMSELFVAKLGA